MEFKLNEEVRHVKNEKSKKSSHMSNKLNDITGPLQLIHVDSFGFVHVMSKSKEKVECSSDDR